TWNIDDTYFPTLGMKIVSGRNFDRSFGQDSMGVILNQTAAKAFGYQDAIGKKIKFVDSDEKFPVIGVVEDFFFESFKEALKPMIFFHSKNNSTTAIRYRSENPRELLQRVEQIWEKHAGGHPFEYSFMDQEFDNRFKEDQKLGSILTFFSALAIFIACLGLFALASFTAEQRKKEISIRKVLGASVSSIIQLLFSNFFKLLLISTAIAVPVGYYLMSNWLDGFAYRTEVGVGVIVVSCLAVFAIAWVTVGSQTFRAARANPADNLHRE
ncbi:MAG: ABC transporter permease, partial [Bacteroidetes bacterium]|nr:ABC transporter permease [Bacteroidota bacterium]